MSATITPPDKLDTKQIADYLQVTRPHVTDRLTKQPDFERGCSIDYPR